ncbi:MAG: hypothetical protein WC315_01120 [Candidatus Omnitrophota bacterium]|jgi:beta-xylosidase
MQRRYIFFCLFILFIVHCPGFLVCSAQEGDIEFNLDIKSGTVPLSRVFRPGIDLSGRGFSRLSDWPKTLAVPEVLDSWQKDIGFNGIFRLSYNLWEINELAKDKDLQNKLLANYEGVLQKISAAGGIAIVSIFGTPAGQGKVLDKRSPPVDFRAFKKLVKKQIKNLSCDKRYNIWYEVWSAPDLDDFFLGRKQEYLNLYRAVASAVQELEAETKVHIPLGGPGVSWWFQDFDGNTIITPERSLIYELIKFCYNYHLPLDFISWHAYSTDPKAERELTAYKKTATELIRAWLSYFRFDSGIPLIIDEWNYDSGANILPERGEKSNVAASFLLRRLRNMQEAGLDYQIYFSLEDFQNNKEGVTSNSGAFWFDPEASEYKGGHKSIYNALRMLSSLGGNMFVTPKPESEFVGIIATKDKDDIVILAHNYIDPQIAVNYLSRNIAGLNNAERRIILNLVKSGEIEKIMRQETDISRIRGGSKLKTLLKKARELNEQAKKFLDAPRNIKVNLKNLKDNYSYQRYAIDSSCSLNCKFTPVEEKEISAADLYQETLVLSPYSAQLLILKKKPKEAEVVTPLPAEQPAQETTAK